MASDAGDVEETTAILDDLDTVLAIRDGLAELAPDSDELKRIDQFLDDPGSGHERFRPYR